MTPPQAPASEASKEKCEHAFALPEGPQCMDCGALFVPADLLEEAKADAELKRELVSGLFRDTERLQRERDGARAALEEARWLLRQAYFNGDVLERRDAFLARLDALLGHTPK